MGNISRILVFLTLFLGVVGFAPGAAQAKSGEYLIGIFGIPEGNFDELLRAGINCLLVRDFEMPRARGLSVKKIYVMGITPKAIREGNVNSTKIEERVRHFKGAGDAYDYYLGDDLKCKHAGLINNIKQRLGIRRGIVGALKGVRCYPEDDILKYHYPLMRRQMSLPEILNQQVRMGNNMHSTNRKLYVCPQAHPQKWYLETIKLGNKNESAMLYPDGQVVRMLIYYALATDADGYFLYNFKGLSGKWSRERLLGAAQAILETKPLTRSLFNSNGAEFFQKTGSVFGTKIRGADYDLFFIFNADYNSHYHPTTSPVKMNLNDIVDPKTYKAVYKYSPVGSNPVTGPIDIPQDHALILVAFKGTVNVEPFKLDPASLRLYGEILQARADKLSANLKLMGMMVPPLKTGASTVGTARLGSILDYINMLNEMKRNDWLKRTSGRMPMNGDELNRANWKTGIQTPVKNEIFNYYYK